MDRALGAISTDTNVATTDQEAVNLGMVSTIHEVNQWEQQ